MTALGFHIDRLTLSGPAVPKAEAELQKGLNVVAGPSDTGKTFMVQCIDYAMGAGDKPKEIPEAAGYDLVGLALQTADGQGYLLERSLRGGDVRVTHDGARRDVSAKHVADREDTISHLLLGFSGLAGKKVRFNRAGVTHNLSFRNVSRLVLIDEESIIAQRSPVLSGQFTQATVETSVFRLLLSGVDDSSVVATDKPKVAKDKREAKVELLDVLLERARAQLQELTIQDGAKEVAASLARIEAAFEQVSEELRAEQQSVAGIEQRRRALWEAVRQADSRLDVLGQLRKRFELLRQQYASDLLRLEAIAEAGGRLAQLTEERCPICGAAAEHHDKTHQGAESTPADVAAACRAEFKKINSLLADLAKTLSDNGAEEERLAAQRLRDQTELDGVAQELRTRLEPRMQAVLTRLRESQAQRDKFRTAGQIFDRIRELEELRGAAEAAPRRTKQTAVTSDVSSSEVEIFSQEVEAMLRDWRFPGLQRVTYSEEDEDIIISGQRRSSHGKGVRALTHAAFTLSLMRYCSGKQLPHPRFVILDSPLVVYREPDPDEKGFEAHVKEAFYRSLASSFYNEQVIVFENDEPPGDLAGTHVIKFSATGKGRRGFIPANPTER